MKKLAPAIFLILGFLAGISFNSLAEIDTMNKTLISAGEGAFFVYETQSADSAPNEITYCTIIPGMSELDCATLRGNF